MNFIGNPLKKILKIKLVSDSFKVLVLRFLGVLLLFGITLFLTNNYNANTVGQYDFIRTFLLVFGSLCLVGTDQSILYFSGILKSTKTIYKLKSVYYKILKIIFLTSATIIIIVVLFGKSRINGFFTNHNTYQNVLKASLVLFFYCLTTLNTEVIRAINKVIISEIIKNVLKHVPFIIGIIILFYSKKEHLLIDVYLVSFLILGIITTIFLLFKLRTFKHDSVDNIKTKEIIQKSFPIAISGVAIFLLMSIDIFFLKKYKGDADVAYYSVALKLMLMLSIIINTININASSKIAEFYSDKNFIELNKLLKNSSRLIFFMSLPIILILLIFSTKILSFFGEEYIFSNKALIIMVICQGICTLFGSNGVYLNMTGRQKIFQYILISSVIINYFFNSILIPQYGMVGAAISFSISLLWWNVVATLYIYKKDNVKIFLR